MTAVARNIGAMAAVVWTLWCWPAAAQGPDFTFDRDAEVTIDARELSYDRRTNFVTATGDVEIRHGETVLRADRVDVNRETQEASATGDAVLTNPNVTIRASVMNIHLLDETGTLRNVEIESETFGFSLSGETIEKREGQRYHIENGLFTTCQCKDPEATVPWSVSGDSLDIDLDGNGEVRGGRFRIKDVPVLYLPRAAFPVSRDRQTGLLFPRVGFSNRRGLQILQPYYWAIDRSQDATFSFDVETAQRVGAVVEHRYALDRRSGGEMQLMYFNEAARGRATGVTIGGSPEVNVPENRWGVIGQHSYASGDTEVFADLLLVGDDVFLREINTFTLDDAEDVTLRTRPFSTSRLGAIHRWNRGYGQIEGVYHQNLVGREAYVLQNTPRATLVGQKKLGMGLLGSLDSSVVSFERSTGITGARVDLSPKLEMRLPLGRSFDGAVSAAYRETAYVLTQDQMFGGFNGTATGADAETLIDLPSTSSREAVEVRGRVATGISRVFDFNRFGLAKLKHTIEPQIEYLYIPSVNQEEQPLFDGDDRLASRNVVSYGFASRFLGKRDSLPEDSEGGGDEVFEVARVSLLQSHDFTGEVPKAGRQDVRNHWSDLDFALRVNGAAGTSLRLESTYDPTRADMTSATVGVMLREPDWIWPGSSTLRWMHRSTFGLQYRFIANNSVPDTITVEQLDSGVLVRVTERVGLRYAARYNVAANRFLSNFFGFSYISACDCWNVDMGISDRANPNEVQFQMQVGLLGFGSSEGGSRAGLRN